MKVVKLKLSTRMYNGLIYRIYQNMGQWPINFGVTSFDMFNNLPLMRNVRYRFLRNHESCKVETWYTHGQLADALCIPESGLIAYKSWSYIPR